VTDRPADVFWPWHPRRECASAAGRLLLQQRDTSHQQ